MIRSPWECKQWTRVPRFPWMYRSLHAVSFVDWQRIRRWWRQSCRCNSASSGRMLSADIQKRRTSIALSYLELYHRGSIEESVNAVGPLSLSLSSVNRVDDQKTEGGRSTGVSAGHGGTSGFTRLVGRSPSSSSPWASHLVSCRSFGYQRSVPGSESNIERAIQHTPSNRQLPSV